MTVNVIGTWLKGDGSPENGKVSFRPSLARFISISTGAVRPAETVTAILDGSGHVSVNLRPTDDSDVQDAPFFYIVTVSVTSQTYQFELSVPTATVGSLDIASQTPSDPRDSLLDRIKTINGVGPDELGNVDVSAVGIDLSQKGAANGVASLDSSSKLVQSVDASKVSSGTLGTSRIPDLSAIYLPSTSKGAVNGVASLNGAGKLMQRVDASNIDNLPSSFATPSVWNAWGHSYMQYVIGTQWPQGRLDDAAKRMMKVNAGDWRNFAIPGAHLIQDGVINAGWARVMQETSKNNIGGTVHGKPYYPDGGAHLFVYGINDLGSITATQAQILSAYQNALRAVIAKVRCSVVFLNNYGGSGAATYGAGFTSTANTSEFSSGTTLRDATTTTAATVTITLPSDYTGQTVVVQFIADAGAAGGTVTFSGTAGVTGTLSTSSIVPSGAAVKVPVVRRITGLSAANAGQTIIMTVTALDAGGKVRFDYWGLEADLPNPVIITNIARITNYGAYTNSFGDSDINTANIGIQSVVNEFDGMVQIADLDGALNKDSRYFASDGLHPNEWGALRAAHAIYAAVGTLVPTTTYTQASMQTVVPTAGYARKPRRFNTFYGPEFLNFGTAAALGASGDIMFMPYIVTEGQEIYTQVALFQQAAGTTSTVVAFGLYDDPKWEGYPQTLWSTGASVGNFTLTLAGAATKAQSGYYWAPDPGLWWIAVKVITVGTGQTFDIVNGPDLTGIMPRSGTTDGSGTFTSRQGMAWQLTGQGTGALPSVAPTGATLLGTAPRIGLLKST